MDQNIKIIIADDNVNFSNMLKEYLQRENYLNIVGIVHNGLDAWEQIEIQKPDLLILDLVMPHLDGLGVLERINEHKTIKRPKIIILTAFGQDSLTKQAMKLGIDYFMLKPFDLDVLSNRILTLTQDITPSTTSAQFLAPIPPVSNKLNHEVTTLMHQCGIPVHVKGYVIVKS